MEKVKPVIEKKVVMNKIVEKKHLVKADILKGNIKEKKPIEKKKAHLFGQSYKGKNSKEDTDKLNKEIDEEMEGIKSDLDKVTGLNDDVKSKTKSIFGKEAVERKKVVKKQSFFKRLFLYFFIFIHFFLQLSSSFCSFLPFLNFLFFKFFPFPLKPL